MVVAVASTRVQAQQYTQSWAAPPIWRGAHFGVHGTYELSDVEFTAPAVANFDRSSFALGVHGGYSWQVGALVAGFEIDATRVGLNGAGFSRGATITSESTFAATGRGRLGVAFDNFLVYGTLGMSAGHFKTSLSGAGVSLSSNDLELGLVYGAGVEMSLMPSLSLRVEALHYDYGQIERGPGGLAFSPDQTSVRAGVTLRLN